MRNITSTREPWAKEDLLFLEDALRRGMSAKDVAGFWEELLTKCRLRLAR
jgi:hypothetical protein